MPLISTDNVSKVCSGLLVLPSLSIPGSCARKSVAETVMCHSLLISSLCRKRTDVYVFLHHRVMDR